MDKTALKDFAIYSRDKLMTDVEIKMNLMGILEEGIKGPLPESTSDFKIFETVGDTRYQIKDDDVGKYEKLIEELERRENNSDYKRAYNTLIEEVAYTWFNRIIAIRFMEVNNYMPDRMRVLSSGKDGIKDPEFLSNYRDTEIGISEDEFKELDKLRLDGSAESMEKMFKFMFVKQCNALHKILPELFERTDDFVELLLPISYLNDDGVISRLINDIDEDAFDIEESGQIEIIGWLYQYYNTELKSEVDAANKKVDKNTLPAKTQLFTPEWIVKYMVENSLGRIWIERLIARGSKKTEEKIAEEYGWKYYLPEAEQVGKVTVELDSIREERKKLNLEDIKFMDPSMGSGHILVYAFDVFMQLYLSEGYMEGDAAENIIEHNLYGLDIDKRAYQLAYFSVMMKGRESSRRILENGVRNNLNYFIDSSKIKRGQLEYLGINVDNKEEREGKKKQLLDLVDLFKHARELGSVIKIEEDYDIEELLEFVDNLDEGKALPMELVGIDKTREDLIHIIYLVSFFKKQYDVIAMNPPYLGLRRMNTAMKEFMEIKYEKYKYDFYVVFIKKSMSMLNENGLLACMTSDVWMYISSYEEFREYIIENHEIMSLIELEKGSFKGASVDILAFILRKNVNHSKSIFIDLEQIQLEVEEEGFLRKKYSDVFIVNTKNFKQIPRCNFAYWVGENTIKSFIKGERLENIGLPRQGMATTANKKFLRKWHEISILNFDKSESAEYIKGFKWLPYNKGGGHRNWYGNNMTVINWNNDGLEVKQLVESKYGNASRTIKNQKFYFQEGITYSFIGITISARKTTKGFLFDVAGSTVFMKDKYKLNYLLALLYSIVSDHYMKLLNPTINIQVGDIKEIPVIKSKEYFIDIDILARKNIEISKIDWDSFETSWDFERNVLLDQVKQKIRQNSIKKAYETYKEYANNNFDQLKENEERLNELFIEIYGLEDELDKYISDKDITICKVFDHKNDIYDDIKGNAYIKTREDIIKDFISYGVGCIFGRYSLDEDGLVYAGGELDPSRYKKIKPVENNIALITDTEYFEDDLINRFIEFVRVSFGEENFRENLEFIADNLKGKGTPREKIRNYFVNDFYDDHVQKYQKTPIYWQYDASAGKTKRQSKNGFKALVYMHRYDEDTTGRVRVDYLHKVQRIYENRMEDLKNIISDKDSDAAIIASSEAELDKLREQLQECREMDEKLGHLASKRKGIDLDDGVKVNYDKVQIGKDDKKMKILAKI